MSQHNFSQQIKKKNLDKITFFLPGFMMEMLVVRLMMSAGKVISQMLKSFVYY